MDTLLIVAALAVLVIAAVVFVRRKGGEDTRPPEARHEQDTAWNDPTSGGPGDEPRP